MPITRPLDERAPRNNWKSWTLHIAGMGDERIVEHAERQLFALAAQLRRVPASGPTRSLHLRALALKREIGQWRARPPDAEDRHRVFAELEELCVLTKEQSIARQLAFSARSAGQPPWLALQHS